MFGSWMISMSIKERPRVRVMILSIGMVNAIGGVELCEVTHRHNCLVLNQYVRNIISEMHIRNMKHNNWWQSSPQLSDWY